MPSIAKFRGLVVKGEGIASTVYDLPTANLAIDQEVLATIDPGVYAAHVYYQENEYEAVAYKDESSKFEIHLFDFTGDLYGKEIKVKLLRKVSEYIPWVSLDRMRQKIQHDVELVMGYFEVNSKNEP